VGFEGDYQNLHFFTEKEICEYFAIDYMMIKIKFRDQKINQLLETDKYN